MRRMASANTPDEKEAIELLDEMQRGAFKYFLDKTNSQTGLVLDSTWKDSPSSIAAVGFGLVVLPVSVERGWISREEAVERSIVTLRFFANSHQGPEADGTGYQGFYYHFLDPVSGQRSWNSELSTIDTSLLLCGMLFAAQYFDGDVPGEREIRDLVFQLYRRGKTQWGRGRASALFHRWAT